MSAAGFEVAVAAAVLCAAAAMAVRRSLRSGLVLFALYAAQAGVLVWASRSIDETPWSPLARAVFLLVIVAVLWHRLTTYTSTRPPAARDRVLVPLVHIGQAWLFLELIVWPVRAMALPPSSSLDAWALAGPFALAAAFLPWTHRRPRTTRLRVVLPSLSRPLRVVHLSDLHVGPYVTDARLAWLAQAVSMERGDLIAITGDFLTLRTRQDWSPVLRFVERLRAPEGVYACLGNHDVEVADALAASLRAAGVIVLRDDVAWLPGRDGSPPVAVAGLDWRAGNGSRQDYAQALASVCQETGEAGPAIMLCHQPSAFRLVPPTFGGIMLAGHLHGGQIGLTWGSTGVSILRLFGMYDQGLFTRGKARLYSHRGTGVYGFPLRIGVPSEIAVLDLVPEERAARTAES